jgi:hypothetical protein
VEGSGRVLILDTIQHFPGRSEENHVKPHDSRSPGRDLNPEPPKHETGVLTTQSRRQFKILLHKKSNDRFASRSYFARL